MLNRRGTSGRSSGRGGAGGGVMSRKARSMTRTASRDRWRPSTGSSKRWKISAEAGKATGRGRARSARAAVGGGTCEGRNGEPRATIPTLRAGLPNADFGRGPRALTAAAPMPPVRAGCGRASSRRGGDRRGVVGARWRSARRFVAHLTQAKPRERPVRGRMTMPIDRAGWAKCAEDGLGGFVGEITDVKLANIS